MMESINILGLRRCQSPVLPIGTRCMDFYGEEASQDEESMQTMRNLARNMIWMMRCFKLGRESGILYPETETDARTSFIKRSDTLR